jgi:hypothetical protein
LLNALTVRTAGVADGHKLPFIVLSFGVNEPFIIDNFREGSMVDLIDS